MDVLLTGAAGYVGSVFTQRLLAEGHWLIAMDNLGQGHRAVLHAEVNFIQVGLCNTSGLDGAFPRHEIDAVMHLAVAESISRRLLRLAVVMCINQEVS